MFTRVFLNEVKPKATLEDIPNSFLDTLSKDYKIDFLYLLGIWQTGPKSIQVSRSLPNLFREMEEQVPDLKEDVDITGSPFAVHSYVLHKDFGNKDSLPSFQKRLKERNLKLIVDFVPNHTGLDCNWAIEHPEYYVHVSLLLQKLTIGNRRTIS